MPGLLTIPLEIRLNIYEQALTVNEINVCSNHASDGTPIFHLTSHPSSYIRLVCRQMATEISGSRMPKLSFYCCGETCMDLFLPSLSCESLAYLGSIKYSTDIEEPEEILDFPAMIQELLNRAPRMFVRMFARLARWDLRISFFDPENNVLILESLDNTNR